MTPKQQLFVDVSRANLLKAAKHALEEMCQTVAPRDSFTDAVDELDAAITAITARTFAAGSRFDAITG